MVSVLCNQHGNIVTPAEVLAVFHTESSTKTQEFRFGPMGRSPYGGPAGIRNCFKGWDDPYQNCILGVQALARLKKRRGSLKGALKIYNAEFNGSYWVAVRQAKKKYE